MSMDELYEQRELLAKKLRECMAARGITKVSLCQRAGISRPTLDRLLRCEINNQSTYCRHVEKILGVLKMTAEELMFFSPAANQNIGGPVRQELVTGDLSGNAQRQYQLLFQTLHLCAAYQERAV